MKKFLKISLLLLIQSSIWATDAASWDTTEKIILSGLVVNNAIDCYQTHALTVRQHDCYEEINPLTKSLFGCRVAWWESAVLKVAIFGPVLYGVNRFVKKSSTRKIILSCLLAISLEPVIRNEHA